MQSPRVDQGLWKPITGSPACSASLEVLNRYVEGTARDLQIIPKGHLDLEVCETVKADRIFILSFLLLVPALAEGCGGDEQLMGRAASRGFYAVDSAGRLLLEIDAFSGAATPIGNVGFQEVRGLALDPNTDILFGVDDATDYLVAIDPISGSGTPIGPVGFPSVRALAFDAKKSVLYGADADSNQLIVIDTSSGTSTPVGPLGFGTVADLAFDRLTGTLYGVTAGLCGAGAYPQLIRIDTTTGSATSVVNLWEDFRIPCTGWCTCREVTGLAFDAATGALYGISWSQLIDVEISTGECTPIGPVILGTLSGLSPL